MRAALSVSFSLIWSSVALSLQPENVLLTADGHCALADFASAVVLSEIDGAWVLQGKRGSFLSVFSHSPSFLIICISPQDEAKQGRLGGTIEYMAPELRPGVVPTRCEISSLCCFA
jgi:serine/threonine protein kinase